MEEIGLLSIALFIIIGLVLGVIGKIIIDSRTMKSVKKESNKIIENATNEADKRRKSTIIETKQEIFTIKQAADKDLKERTKAVVDVEQRLAQREDRLDSRATNLDRRDESLDKKENQLDSKKIELEEKNIQMKDLISEQEKKLIEISKINVADAQKLIMEKVESDMANEISSYIKDAEFEAKLIADKKAKMILANSIMAYANDATTERTVSVIHLPSDDMKGRIIGREGRNIRAIEALTGVDLIVDDTPQAVVLSGFDPIRRAIARKTLDSLVADGRIHPARIEELVEKCRKEIDIEIREAGEQAVFETGIGKIHPDLVKLIGRLKYRTSYGQNVLKHSIETAFFTGRMAAELGENELLARRAGLLHDIGKGVDHEIEGSHVDIGISLAKRYKEKREVIDGIASHHGDQEPNTIIAVLVAAADKLSAARPGARSESIENYVKRLEQLEEISNKIEGVEKAYAIQAGREIRVVVRPEEIDDLKAHTIARQIKEKIEKTMAYPGTIKVIVIRETRAVDVAK